MDRTPGSAAIRAASLAIGVVIVAFGMATQHSRAHAHAAAARPPAAVQADPISVPEAPREADPPGVSPRARKAAATARMAPPVGAYTAITGSLIRAWQITARCSGPARCSYTFTRSVPDLGRNESGTLVPAADGWHVTFPWQTINCPCRYRAQARFVLEFEDGGRAITAHEVHHYTSPLCGTHDTLLDWRATRVGDAGPVVGVPVPVQR
jgi:hypothetical protein